MLVWFSSTVTASHVGGELEGPKTYVYVAGLEKMRAELDAVFTTLAVSEETWARRKAELMAGKRWVELLY